MSTSTTTPAPVATDARTETVGRLTFWALNGRQYEAVRTSDGILRVYFQGLSQGRFRLDRAEQMLVCTSDAGVLLITRDTVGRLVALDEGRA